MNSKYMQNYRRRIKWFLLVSGLFMTYLFAGLFFSLFMDGNIGWDDDVIYIAYFGYLACFTGYNWFRYHQNSLQEEEKQKVKFQDPDFLKWSQEIDFPMFDHKAGRKSIGRISFWTILFNVVMIIVKLLFESF